MQAKRNISLGKSDIVFLDHSCNDAGGKTPHGIEYLIRSIYRTIPNEAEKPTLVVLEILPFGKDPAYNEIYNGYRSVAEYYHLPVFSHFEILRSPVQSQENLFGLLTVQELHLPWPGHLLIADELAQWIAELIDFKCVNVTSSSPLSNFPAALTTEEDKDANHLNDPDEVLFTDVMQKVQLVPQSLLLTNISALVVKPTAESLTNLSSVAAPAEFHEPPTLLHRYSFEDGSVSDSVAGSSWAGTLSGGASIDNGHVVLSTGSYLTLPSDIFGEHASFSLEAWVSIWVPSNFSGSMRIDCDCG